MAARWKAMVLYSLVALIVGTALAVRISSSGEHDLDEALCQRGAPPPAHVVILLDPTDPFSAAEAYTGRDAIWRRAKALQPGERFSVLAIRPQQAGPVTDTLFSRCRPRDGSDAQPIKDNKRKLQKRYREEFEAPLGRVMAELEALPGAKTSPILASLREIATMPSFAEVARRELLIVSDLLEHSSELSHYDCRFRVAAAPGGPPRPAPPRAPAQRRSRPVADRRGAVPLPACPRAAALPKALAGVDVLVLQRASARTRPYQDEAHQQFWQATMHAAGARYDVQPL